MSNISTLVEHFPYWGLFILLILGGIVFPFPEDMTLILCGFLISHDVVNPIPALPVVYSGLLIADIFLYLAGKKYGRQIVTHKRFQKIISSERLSMLEDKFNKKGILIILLGRHLIGLRVQIFLVAGIMRMSALKFLVADGISSLFTMAVMIGAGYIGGNSLQVIKRDITRIEHIAILGAVIFFAIYMSYRYFKGRNN